MLRVQGEIVDVQGPFLNMSDSTSQSDYDAACSEVEKLESALRMARRRKSEAKARLDAETAAATGAHI